MDGITRKLSVLSHIAGALNRQNIVWAVGGSLLLYLKGIAADFADIDVMVAEADAQTAKGILMSLGDIRPAHENAKYKTRCFWQFHVSGVDLDVMAGFAIMNEGQEYYFPLIKESVVDCAVVNEVRIPLQSLKEWRQYYGLMGRDEKVKLIDAAAKSI
ncbi:MAG: hypothetical protein PHP07_09390 [Eubacteriales bacterium]|nr:hypothetical protein [Eubacteriales bacterium]